MSERALKFMRAGAHSPFTGIAWTPGQWVDAEGKLDLCRNGIHACRLEALPRWIDDELWWIEIEDPSDEFEGVVVARRGRLLERVEGWNADTSRELARSCVREVSRLAGDQPNPTIRIMAGEIGAIAEGPDPSATALAMYCTAHAFDVAMEGGYAAERHRQSEWLRKRLRLEAAGMFSSRT